MHNRILAAGWARLAETGELGARHRSTTFHKFKADLDDLDPAEPGFKDEKKRLTKLLQGMAIEEDSVANGKLYGKLCETVEHIPALHSQLHGGNFYDAKTYEGLGNKAWKFLNERSLGTNPSYLKNHTVMSKTTRQVADFVLLCF